MPALTYLDLSAQNLSTRALEIFLREQLLRPGVPLFKFNLRPIALLLVPLLHRCNAAGRWSLKHLALVEHGHCLAVPTTCLFVARHELHDLGVFVGCFTPLALAFEPASCQHGRIHFRSLLSSEINLLTLVINLVGHILCIPETRGTKSRKHSRCQGPSLDTP